MKNWSFSLGRVMGVEIRVHTFFLLLLALSMADATAAGGRMSRGVGLWFALLFALAVREIARSIAAACMGLEMRSLLLLPIGGLAAYVAGSGYGQSKDAAEAGSAEKTERRRGRADDLAAQRWLAAVGPVTNLLFALLLAALIHGASSQVNLFEKPFVTPMHLIRSMMWIQVGLAALHLLPAYPLDMGRVLQTELATTKARNSMRIRGRVEATRAAAGISQVLALLLVIAGAALFQNAWIAMAGLMVLLGSQMEDQGHVLQSVVDSVRMKDVMLTEFATISASATYEDAVAKAIHSLQEDFPVVRGRYLVGVVSRQSVLEALSNDGNGYVQGVMQREYQAARPDDSLGKVFRNLSRANAMGAGTRGLEVVPVLEGRRVVGIVTLQNLRQSMGLLAETRRRIARTEAGREL